MLTEQKINIAEAYLERLRSGASHSTARYYVRAAHEHGVPVERIAMISRIPLNRVALMVEEG
ncbi:hypothetical protein [Microbacterium gubbeenense]|uniref:hypothetical protein n=1 Tax=Microbacterium gubbeenense TaxID=159896 RepID=UPI003F9B1A91